ncbi:M12 family metallo-peptidase [Marinicella sediminis]|uniref:M12 family metallo-peptidase n=1 Tax=Marinicella sediminis TaxID=1792834 RepID=A0ABV7J3Q0_9GAMM|nr:M12 family metallo-peptidase [Marinicella sediminis]
MASLVELNHQLLTNRVAEFDVTLPDGVLVTVVFEDLKIRSDQRYSWSGHLKGQPEEQLIISAVNGFYAGALYSKSTVYELSPSGEGQLRVAALQSAAFHECDGDVPVNVAVSAAQPEATSTRGITDSFDVLVVYTPEARDASGGDAGIQATAQAAVDAMNLSFSNSGVDAEGVLVRAQLVAYNDSGSSSDDLNWVRADPTVAAIRDSVGADLVSLLANNIGGSCGRGYVMNTPGPGFESFAFQVTARGCAVGNLSFAHEFGHNLGLQHNPENSNTPPANASFPWSYGHYHNGSYRTVLSYSAQCGSGCTRRPYFSNPDVLFNNLPTGTEDERDNARSLEQTVPIAADFRARVNDLIFDNGFDLTLPNQ